MNGRRFHQFFALWAIASLWVGMAAGGEVQGPVFTVIEENDLVVNTDHHYTQGVRLSYLHADGYFPFGTEALYRRIPEIGFEKEVGKFGYAVGQNIYTPSRTDLTQPPESDRPYAGWLYLGAILQRRGTNWLGRPSQEDFELDFGVVGPASLAKEAQIWVHEIRGFDLPQGWRFQLKNEPAVRLKYQRSMRFRAFSADPFTGEWLPHFGLSLGNVETSVRVGGTARLGFNLPDDFGVMTIDSLGTSASGRPVGGAWRTRWSLYVFAGAEMRAVAYSIFLDGNLFRGGPEIEKEPLVGDFKTGFAVAYGAVEVGYTHVFRTPEFVTQAEEDSFGAVFLKWRF